MFDRARNKQRKGQSASFDSFANGNSRIFICIRCSLPLSAPSLRTPDPRA
jgi:hypothetical protein